MHKKLLLFASFCGLLSVALGAMGTHALKNTLSPTELGSFETATKYLFLHAIAILLTSTPMLQCTKAALFWAIGMIFFAGSIYLWLLTGFKPLVHLAPLGGMSFMTGWVLLCIFLYKKDSN